MMYLSIVGFQVWTCDDVDFDVSEVVVCHRWNFRASMLAVSVEREPVS